jgi:putative transposase
VSLLRTTRPPPSVMEDGAVLAEQHDEWAEGRRYLCLDVLARCRMRPVPEPTIDANGEEVTAPNLPALSA